MEGALPLDRGCRKGTSAVTAEVHGDLCTAQSAMLSKEMHSVSPCLSGVHKVWLLLKIVRLAGLAGLAALLLRSDGGLLAAYVPALVAAAVLSKNRALTIAVWTAAVVVDSWSGAVGPRRHGGGRALGLDWVAGLHGYPADPSPVERQGGEGGGERERENNEVRAWDSNSGGGRKVVGVVSDGWVSVQTRTCSRSAPSAGIPSSPSRNPTSSSRCRQHR